MLTILKNHWFVVSLIVTLLVIIITIVVKLIRRSRRTGNTQQQASAAPAAGSGGSGASAGSAKKKSPGCLLVCLLIILFGLIPLLGTVLGVMDQLDIIDLRDNQKPAVTVAEPVTEKTTILVTVMKGQRSEPIETRGRNFEINPISGICRIRLNDYISPTRSEEVEWTSYPNEPDRNFRPKGVFNKIWVIGTDEPATVEITLTRKVPPSESQAVH